MRIAIGCVGFPTLSETFILNQVVGFRQEGHSVDIYPYFKTSYDGTHESFFKWQLQKHIYPGFIPPKNHLARFVVAVGHLFARLPKARLLFKTLNYKKFGHAALNLQVFYSALSLVQQQPYDIYIAHFGENGVGFAALKRAGVIKGKLVTYFHGYDLHCNEQDLPNRQNFYKQLFREGDAFITNTFFSKNKLLNLGAPANKTYIIPVGLTIDDTMYGKRNRKTSLYCRIISVGRLIEVKGHVFGIKAIEALNRTHPDLKLIYTIVGDGSLKKELQSYIDERGLNNSVILAGSKTQEEIAELLESSEIFLHPSVEDSLGRAEAQGLAIQEAQAAGLPVVAFRSGGIPEGVPSGTGILVQEKNVKELSNAIFSLFSSPEMRQMMGEEGRRWVKSRYDITDLNKQILQIVTA